MIFGWIHQLFEFEELKIKMFFIWKRLTQND